MKYYYNGKLIRTSKTHDDYKYALIDERHGCVSCSKSRTTIQTKYNQYTASLVGMLAAHQRVLDGTCTKSEKKWVRHISNTDDMIRAEIDRMKAILDDIKIVELEARG